jgi:hypothetical protein
MIIDPQRFNEQFEVFKKRVLAKSKKPFVSFREGLPFQWEGYKEPLRKDALAALAATTWQKSDIGSGRILKRVVASIEVPKADDHDANNFVSWHEGFGYNSQSHHRLLDATQEPSVRKKIEQWAFAFYREGADPGDAFEEMQEIAGTRYDLLAYFMFLKDSTRFMPLKVRTFDAAFHELGIDLKTDAHCSWENYQEFMEALFAIHAELLRQPGQADATLVDAHSFCWLLVRKEMEPADKLFVESAKGKASNAKIFNAIENAVYDMVYQATQTAASSNGQQVLVTRKNKELLVSPEELRTHVAELLKKYKNTCALTGIPLRFKGVDDDKALWPSLDRIDSNGHYTPGNVQVVCRFINGWKGATPDDEFRRLLDLVRKPVED